MKRNYITILSILIAAIILLIIGICSMLIKKDITFFVNTNDVTMDTNYRHQNHYNDELNMMNGTSMVAQNSYMFFEKSSKYFGEYSKEIQESWDDFVRITVPKYYKEVKDEEKYYENNKVEIYSKTGIDDYDTFKNLMDKIRKLGSSNEIKLKGFSLDDIQVEKRSVNLVLVCEYDGGFVNFDVTISLNPDLEFEYK